MTMNQLNGWKKMRYKGLIGDLKWIVTQEKINEADYVPAHNAVCTTEAITVVDILIQLYHD